MYAQEFPSEKGPGEEHLIDTLCDRYNNGHLTHTLRVR